MDQPSDLPPCARHPGERATATCSRCGDFTCPACQLPGETGPLCPSCAARREERPAAAIPPGSSIEPFAIAGRSLGLTWKLLVRGSLLHVIPAPLVVAGCIAGIANTVAMGPTGPRLIGAFVGVGFILAVAALHAPAEVVLAQLFHDRLCGGSKGVVAAAANAGGRSLHLVWVELLRALIVCLPLVPLLVVKTGEMETLALWAGCLFVSALLIVPLSVAVPVVVFEGLGGSAALRRSFALVARAPLRVGSQLGGASVVALVFWSIVGGCGGAALPVSSTVQGFFAIGFMPLVGLFMAAVVTSLYFGLRTLEAGR